MGSSGINASTWGWCTKVQAVVDKCAQAKTDAAAKKDAAAAEGRLLGKKGGKGKKAGSKCAWVHKAVEGKCSGEDQSEKLAAWCGKMNAINTKCAEQAAAKANAD